MASSIPEEPLLGLKGIAIVLADGISIEQRQPDRRASPRSRASSTDYYCTSESWSVKTSAQRVLAATNSWLHAQTRRSQYSYDKDKGYVCTLSAMVIKSTTAHIFHVGDCRIYRVVGQRARTADQGPPGHRFVASKAISAARSASIRRSRSTTSRIRSRRATCSCSPPTASTSMSPARFIASAIRDSADDLDGRARRIVEQAYEQGSPDNLTVQIVRIDALPAGEASEVFGQPSELPLPPLLEARMVFDGYRIVRELHASSRSHIYLAVDADSDELVALKIPSIDLRGDPAYLKRFMMEEWVARRINSAHVLKPCLQSRKRNYLYVVTEFIDGQTLAQWMIDNPKPDLETVRGIVEQIAKGLRAFHRMEMLHQDLRPDNIMIDKTGTVKIIDFGSTRVTGVVEASPPAGRDDILGTCAIHRAGIFPGRERLVALRYLLARRHHLPDADGPAALWREDGADANQVAAAQTEIPHRARR